MVDPFVEVCRRRGLKVNADKSKMLVLGGEEGLECEIRVDGTPYEQVIEFKYLGCVFHESGMDVAKSLRKIASGRKVASAIRSLVNARGLELGCARMLHEALLESVLFHSSETMIGIEKEKSRIRAVQWVSLRGLLLIRRMKSAECTD